MKKLAAEPAGAIPGEQMDGRGKMLGSVASKLQRSIKNGDPYEPDWFGAALDMAVERNKGLDLVIWEAVRELLEYRAAEKVA